MKTVLVASILAAAFGVNAATFEETKALSETPYAEITEANAVQVAEACVAMTNSWKLTQLAVKKFISFEKAAELATNNGALAGSLFETAKASSNDTIKANAFVSLIDTAIVSAPVRDIDILRLANSLAKMKDSKIAPADILAAVKKLVANGKTTCAMGLLYNNIDSNVFVPNGYPVKEQYQKYLGEYAEYGAANIDMFWNAWLAEEPAYNKSGTLVNFFAQGGAIVNIYGSKLSNVLGDKQRVGLKPAYAKCAVYAADGCVFWWGTSDFAIAMSKVYINSADPKCTEKAKVSLAKNPLDAAAKNKDASAALWETLKDPVLKLQVALYLKDTDKVIDSLLLAKSELSAADIEKTLPILNDLDVDYRAKDVLKALRNINARYTIKLYDDRATWEPILSKIRAMIDTL